jgi:TctA family transporter
MFERAAIVAWWLMQGEALTPHMLAAVHGMPVGVAGVLLERVERALSEQVPLVDGFDRTVYVVGRLAAGETLTTMDVAQACHTSRQTAYNTLVRICRVVPVYQAGRRWQVCAMGELT